MLVVLFPFVQKKTLFEILYHGALCVSYSGQCYASQVTRGRSANRGECAQLCRLPYTLVDGSGNRLSPEGHLLSLKDLDLSAHLGAMTKRTKIWIGIAAILVLILIGFFACKKEKQQPAVPQTAKVTMGTISASVTATGTVSPIKTITVGTQVSGTIYKIYVDYNSVIKKGQLLAELDKTVLNSTYQSALTDLNVNKTQMDYQEKNFNRIKDLYAKQAVSKTDYETAEYNYNTAKLNYKRSQSDVIKAKTNLNYATIYSPIDGVVLSRAVEEGQTVAAAMPISNGKITADGFSFEIDFNGTTMKNVGTFKDDDTITLKAEGMPAPDGQANPGLVLKRQK